MKRRDKKTGASGAADAGISKKPAEHGLPVDFVDVSQSPARPTPEVAERRERVKDLATRLSILSGLLGLPTIIVGLVRLASFSSAENGYGATQVANPIVSPARLDAENDLEREKLRAELRAAEPRFDITYVSVDTRKVQNWREGELKKVSGFERVTIAENELTDQGAKPSMPAGKDEATTPSGGEECEEHVQFGV